MSDTSKTPESKTYKPILYVHPFYPTFSIKEVPEGAAPIYQVKFNQAYVYYHSDDALIESPIEISGMSSSFQLGDDAKTFYVELVLTDGSPTSAAFMEGDLPDNDDDNKYFFVCEIEDFNIKSFKLRENIHWNTDGSSSIPYTIYFADETVLTLSGIYNLYDPDSDNDWSAEFAVSSGEMTQGVVYNSTTDRGIGAGTQTVYRLPLIRSGVKVSSGGLYEEYISCKDGSPKTLLIKVG